MNKLKIYTDNDDYFIPSHVKNENMKKFRLWFVGFTISDL